MPGMDGIELLSHCREKAPDTVRIMLTGVADMEAAIRVVNEGNIFRFLTKPCPAEVLEKALADAQASTGWPWPRKNCSTRLLAAASKS